MAVDMALVFKALADPTRRQLLDRLRVDNGQTLSGLCAGVPTTRQGITQHLEVLEGAGLVATIRRGRDKLHYLNPVPIQEISERWINKFEVLDLAALSGLKRQLEVESKMNDKPSIVYITYIASTPERVWSALTDPELTAVYWAHRNVSRWTVGSTWEHQRLDEDVVDGGGTIIEIDPPRRLVHTWGEIGGDAASQSRVTFDIEPTADDVVRVTVTHENLSADEVDDARMGWSVVLSSLKSFVETGRPLSTLAH